MNDTYPIFSTQELAQFSVRNLMDDRQDFIIEALNRVVCSAEASIEDKVLALDKLGDIYQNYTGDLDKSLEHINMAIELADSIDIRFSYVLRGSIWLKRLQLLELLGRNDEIESELQKITNKYETEEFNSNSYLFNAYKYKAKLEYDRGTPKAALGYLIDAQKYYPVKFYAKKLHVIEASDYKNEFDNLELLLSRNVFSTKDWNI
ncbi:MAG: hypothetical protein K0R09_1612 [Clostridiales bacterium]|nr:hypothetical protein [Clostridiales bacterium]